MKGGSDNIHAMMPIKTTVRLSVHILKTKKKYLDIELVQETIIDLMNSCCATTEKDLKNNTAICDLDILIVLLAKFL